MLKNGQYVAVELIGWNRVGYPDGNADLSDQFGSVVGVVIKPGMTHNILATEIGAATVLLLRAAKDDPLNLTLNAV